MSLSTANPNISLTTALNTRIAIGKILRARRLSLGLTLLDVASMVAVTPQQVWKYERGASTMTVDMLVLMSRAVQSTPIKLLSAINPMLGGYPEDEPLSLDTTLSDANFLRLKVAYHNLKNEESRRMLVSLAIHLASE